MSKYSPPHEIVIPDDESDRLVNLARNHFGYENIHDYQLQAAYAMLTGIDTSIILGTGAGQVLGVASELN